MQGRAVSAEQKRFHDDLCRFVGCIACRMDGVFNDYVSIHHIDGRTKPDAHWHVLPMCAGHHQNGTGAPGLIAVHPYKRRFEGQYGTQEELLKACLMMLERIDKPVPSFFAIELSNC